MSIDQARAALEAGDSAQAERLARQCLEDAPNDVDAHVLLAELVLAQGAIGKGIALLRRALDLAPTADRLRLYLASLHQQQGHYPAALALIEQVQEPLRNSFEVQAVEAALLGQLGRRDDEIALYERLLGERPDDEILWRSQGSALNYAGRTDQATEAFRRAIDLRPSFGEAWWGLANLKRFRFEDRDIAAMQAALDDQLSSEDALHFHFALGRAHEQRGEYRPSFDQYLAGNRLRSASLDPERMRVTHLVDESIATFTKAMFERNAGGGAVEHDPIFVVGLQRSGSTLIEQILASHPDIEGTAELLTMQHRLGTDWFAAPRTRGSIRSN